MNKLNKKGSVIAGFLIVILAFILIFFTLFTFVKSGDKQKEVVLITDSLEMLDAQEYVAEYFLQKVVELAFYETYSEFMKNSEFVDESCGDVNNVKNFCKLKSEEKLKQDFESAFKEKTKDKMSEYDGKNKVLQDIKDLISQESFEINFNYIEGKVEFKSHKINMGGKIKYRDEEKVVIEKSFLIEKEISFSDFNLISFQQLNNSVFKCKTGNSAQEIKTCLDSDLKDFESEVQKQGTNWEIKLVSKKLYVLQGNLRRAEFRFLV